MSNNEFHQRRLSATPRGVGVMCNFFAQSAENATLKDVEGNEYIDFAAGIAVLNTGHRHPDLVAAVEQQLQQFTHTAYQIVPYESYVTLAEKINALAPVSGQAKTAFFTTGAEAVENAVKIARAHTGRPGVIAFSGGFHGRTYMTMALTGKVAPYKIGFGPFHLVRCITYLIRQIYTAFQHRTPSTPSNACLNQTSKRSRWRRLFSNRCRARAVSTLRQKSWLPLFAACATSTVL